MTSALVTGGTGTLGRLVVPRLRAAGHDVRVLSRKKPSDAASAEGVEFVTGDLATGVGIQAALAGVDVIVHCAGTNKQDDAKARTLVEAARQAAPERPPHLVFISVVGADQIPATSAVDRAMFGYFASKRAAELVVSQSGLPWTTLRATQFHELILMVAKGMAKLPVVPSPVGMRFQPVAAADVADRLVELALGSPAGLVPDIGGPKTYQIAELLRDYLRAAGKRRPLLPVWLPGKAARAVRDGAILAPNHATGTQTWEDFLASQVSEVPHRGEVSS
ncbi:MAG TPA: NAD(P)H-binding protein [Streptosporangiaceae bacterium]|nr:NAD(P)H-binding protein [Streptosporangiaceae bacterium]